MTSNPPVPNIIHIKGSRRSPSLLAKLNNFKKGNPNVYTMSDKTQIIEKIESLAIKQGHKIAIETESKKLSYKDYFNAALALSSHLKSLGLGTEDNVVVFLAPSENIPIALLSILMTGAVYIPIDTSWPKVRIDAIFEEVAPKVILTQESLQYHFRASKHCEIVNLDTHQKISDNNNSYKTSCAKLTDTAVIFYTSGSTGMPKGVKLSYKNIQSFMESASETYRFEKSDVHLSIAKYSFSISLFDLLLPFYCGGSLKLEAREKLLNPGTLAKLVSESSCFHMGPALLESLVRHSEDSSCNYTNIRHISSGGDMIPSSLLERSKAIFPNAEIWVIYGCTEVACMGTTWQVDRGAVTNTTFVGTTFKHSDVILLDESLHLVEQEVLGEVYISGDGVTPGYLNRDELNKTKFVDFDKRRYYATGDYGIVNSNGNLQLKGRKDFQIKINGVRIETEEIEYWLNQIDGIEQSIVIGARDIKGVLKIVSFVLRNSNSDNPSEILIKQQLTTALPEYMVPNKVYFIDSLPLNTNGKLDRNALISTAEENLADNRSGIDNNDKIAKRLLDIWFYAGASGIVLDDSNFFDLGGDSLGAVQLFHTINADFNLNCDFEFIYAHPTFSEQLKAIKNGFVDDDSTPKSIIVHLDNKPSSTKTKIFVTPGMDGHIVSFHNFGSMFSDDISAYGFLYPNFENEEYKTITSVCDKLIKELLEVQKDGPYYLCGHSSGGIISLEIARTLKAMGKQAYLILIEARIFEKAPRKPLKDVLKLYIKHKPRLYLEKLFNSQAKHYVGNPLDSNNRAKLKDSLKLPKLKGAFTISKTQLEHYSLKPCDVDAILIKGTKTIWWDGLRTWPSDYGLGEFVNLISTSHSSGDHVSIAMDKANHAELATIIENEMSRFGE
ncbi:MAG: AMP-binding protein [Paraglaciecola sp.]|uniref:non-ribosomal peptide synthetase family protein n=1 Tax=Paraglaciecola sp. TaxID=1920173 RepID=UPI0032976329